MYTPLLDSKTGVYKGIHFFLIFSLKHRLWVTTIYVLSKNKKNITIFHLKITNFSAVKKNHSILHRRVYVMTIYLNLKTYIPVYSTSLD